MLKKLHNLFKPFFTKEILKPIGQVLTSQLLLQIISFSVGILLVREMEKTDYAIYTILMSIQAMLSIISGSGIMIGFRKIGGQIYQNQFKLASLINTGLLIRSYVTIGAFIISGSYGAFLLLEHNIPIIELLFFLVCVLFIVIPSINTAFLDEALLLTKDVLGVQLKNILSEIIRLICLLLVFFTFKNLFIIKTVLIVTIFAKWMAYIYILKRSENIRNKNVPIIPEFKRTLIHYIKILWHNELYFAFNSQISIFLIATFGSTNNIAELGALSKFSFIFTTLTVLVSQIFGPLFSRSKGNRELQKQYLRLILMLGVLSFCIYLSVSLFSNYFLIILGEDYLSLSEELKLFMGLGIVNLFVAATTYLNQARGWVKYRPAFEIPINLLSLFAGIWIFDMTQLTGVIYLSILIAFSNLALSLANSYAGFKEIKIN